MDVIKLIKEALGAVITFIAGLFLWGLFTKKEESDEMAKKSKDNFADLDRDAKARILRNIKSN